MDKYTQELYVEALKFYNNQLSDEKEFNIENSFVKNHKLELIYCYQEKLGIEVFDDWTRCETLLNERLAYDEFQVLNFENDVFEMDAEKNSIEINANRIALTNYRKNYRCKTIADEIIYEGLKESDIGNRIWYKNELEVKYQISDRELEKVGANIATDDENVVDIDFYSLNTEGEINLIFNFTRCPNYDFNNLLIKDDNDLSQLLNKSVQKEYSEIKANFHFEYNKSKHCATFTNKESFEETIIENVYSPIQAKKQFNDFLYDMAVESIVGFIEDAEDYEMEM